MDSTAVALKSASSSFFSKLPNLNPNPNRLSPSNFATFSLKRIIKSIQTPNSDHLNPPSPSPLKSNLKTPNSSTSPFSCSAVTSPSPVSDLAATKLYRLTAEFQSLSEPIDRVKRLLHYATLLPPSDESLKVISNRVMGCTAQVWLDAKLDNQGKMRFKADSDSEISRGFCSCLVWILDGAAPEEVLSVKTDDLAALSVASNLQNSRVNTWHNVLISMQKRTKALVAEREGKPLGEPFPSLIVTAEGIHAKGSYAEAQARFLFPDDLKVKELASLLKERKIGVVAHFYMDPEVQGVLTTAQKLWPHIHISDSLVMADMAVKMAKEGCRFITVLGVDFMSENVRAILDQAGFPEVGVYRMSDERIGCSLADAASSPAYMDYLAAASVCSPSLHVVYINTSLETKAHAHELVPTITCTSSNVVQTILQAFAEVPNLNVWYGSDSYMGANIVEFLKQMTIMRVMKKLSRYILNTIGIQLNHYCLVCTIIRTESGMVTAIVALVRKLLGSVKSASTEAKVSVEIVFPVSSESVTRTSSTLSHGPSLNEVGDFIKVPVIPGAASGEGCSINGGYASCPCMKMNSLTSLLKVCKNLPNDKDNLSAYKAGRSVCVPQMGN